MLVSVLIGAVLLDALMAALAVAVLVSAFVSNAGGKSDADGVLCIVFQLKQAVILLVHFEFFLCSTSRIVCKYKKVEKSFW